MGITRGTIRSNIETPAAGPTRSAGTSHGLDRRAVPEEEVEEEDFNLPAGVDDEPQRRSSTVRLLGLDAVSPSVSCLVGLGKDDGSGKPSPPPQSQSGGGRRQKSSKQSEPLAYLWASDASR